jgi:hypothetical protein
VITFSMGSAARFLCQLLPSRQSEATGTTTPFNSGNFMLVEEAQEVDELVCSHVLMPRSMICSWRIQAGADSPHARDTCTHGCFSACCRAVRSLLITWVIFCTTIFRSFALIFRMKSSLAESLTGFRSASMPFRKSGSTVSAR